MGSVPWSGGASGGGHGSPLQYSCLENPMDREAWKTIIHVVAKSWTQLKLLSMKYSPPGFPVLHYLPEFAQIQSIESVSQFSRSVMSNPLQLHGLQHTRPPCPSPAPRVYSNSCPLSWWCDPIISSSVVPFSSRLRSFPASGSFLMSHLFASGGQKFRFNISPPNEYSGLISFMIDWLDLLAVQGTLKSLLQHHSSKASILWCSAFFIVQLTSIHEYWKTIENYFICFSFFTKPNKP